jgi:uncharacterized protein YndB with AHSA1/START domain
MARAHASTVIDAPIEKVWATVRDFNALPAWNPGVVSSEVEDGLASDVVGCVRRFRLADGRPVRERLLSLSDASWSFSYNFESPAFPVENYLATMRLMPVTKGNRTFVAWDATFDEAPQFRGRHVEIISRDVFAVGLAALKARVSGGCDAPEPATRWKGGRPAKVFCSSVIDGTVDRVWAVMRDFAGMGAWHPEISRMHMLDGKRGDQVGGVRDFLFGDGRLHEELLHVCDLTRSFSYRITTSPMPWMNYVAGPRLWPVSDSERTFAVWTADWIASPQDDLTLIPNVHHNVFQKAFDTLNEKFFSAPGAS